jgi:hypothetical protein
MKSASKKRSAAKKNAPVAEPAETFRAWQARVLALLDERTASTARGWSNMFVRGLTPEQAADAISRNAYNASRSSERLKRR